jgi:hypothetical protein
MIVSFATGDVVAGALQPEAIAQRQGNAASMRNGVAHFLGKILRLVRTTALEYSFRSQMRIGGVSTIDENVVF